MDIDRELFQWFIHFLIKKFVVKCIKNENISKEELEEELHKSIIKKFKTEKYNQLLLTICGDQIKQTCN